MFGLGQVWQTDRRDAQRDRAGKREILQWTAKPSQSAGAWYEREQGAEPTAETERRRN